MLNAVHLDVSQVDEFFRRQWAPIRHKIRYEIDDDGHYTVFNTETNAVVQSGWIAPGGSKEEIRAAIFENLRDGMPVFALGGEALKRYGELLSRPELALSAVIVSPKKDGEFLVESTSVAWAAIVERVGNDWSKVTEFTSEQWEQIIAGAYKEAGYDEVTITPRSGDHGRDVIAIRNGIGSVKIIGSVKAYKPGSIVGYDHIRALIGVISSERDVSKGIITTTSDFPPKVMEDPFIAPLIPHRLELMNGDKTREWLKSLLEKRNR